MKGPPARPTPTARTLRLLALLALSALVALAASGCGSGDAERVAVASQERAEALRDDIRALRDQARSLPDARALRGRAERLRRRLEKRVRDTLERLERRIPAAGPTTTAPGRGDASLEAFLTEILRSVDAYWTTTLTASGLEEPRVGFNWLAPGRSLITGCRNVADDDAALYCPADDTIYVSQAFAGEVLAGIREDFPGQRAGQGRAVGDFGVAYIVAHEYAHNVQQELGFFTSGRRLSVEPFELQADCMAGLWGNSVYRAGRLKPGDVEEALGTAKAVGDFEYLSPQHHGTPEQRREAWLAGYESGDPSSCRRYVAN